MGLTPGEWIALGQWLIMAGAAVWLWSTGKITATTTLISRVDAVEKALLSDKVDRKEWQDWIGQKVSDLGTAVQGMPERLRGIFLTVEIADQLIKEQDKSLVEIQRRLLTLEGEQRDQRKRPS